MSVLKLLPEVMYHRMSAFAIEVLLLLFDDGHHFLSEEAIGRHKLNFARRFDLGAVTYSFVLGRLVMLRMVIRATTVASDVVEERKSDFMYFFLELVDFGSVVLHFDVKHLLKLLSLFFIFKSFRFFNLVLPLRINQLVQLVCILMRPFGFHDVKVLVLKDLIGRQWLFWLFFRLELIDLILEELDLHLILVA